MLGTLLSVLLLGFISPISLANPALPIPPPSVEPPLRPEYRSQDLVDAVNATSASGVVIMDTGSSQILASKHPDSVLPMASLTKLMTALLVVEHDGLDERATVPGLVRNMNGTSNVSLRGGEILTVRNLLTLMLVSSSNEAAQTLAVHIDGSVNQFVARMNARAGSLGLHRTYFENPTGFDAPRQRSTARDLAWLTLAALRHPEIAGPIGMSKVTVRSASGTVFSAQNTHQLLGHDPQVIAGKTGTTGAARECLITIVEHAGRRSIIVLLHSEKRYDDLRGILAALPPP